MNLDNLSWGFSLAYNESFKADIGPEIITWVPFEPHLWATPKTVFDLMHWLNGDDFDLSPTGPTIKKDYSDAYAARLAIEALYPEAKFSDNAPNINDLFPEIIDGAIY